MANRKCSSRRKRKRWSDGGPALSANTRQSMAADNVWNIVGEIRKQIIRRHDHRLRSDPINITVTLVIVNMLQTCFYWLIHPTAIWDNWFRALFICLFQWTHSNDIKQILRPPTAVGSLRSSRVNLPNVRKLFCTNTCNTKRLRSQVQWPLTRTSFHLDMPHFSLRRFKSSSIFLLSNIQKASLAAAHCWHKYGDKSRTETLEQMCWNTQLQTKLMVENHKGQKVTKIRLD